jgi:hypothetical protein
MSSIITPASSSSIYVDRTALAKAERKLDRALTVTPQPTDAPRHEAAADRWLQANATPAHAPSVAPEGPQLNPPQSPAPAPEALKNGLQGILDTKPKQAASLPQDNAAATAGRQEQPIKADQRNLPQGIAAQGPINTFDFEKNFQVMTKVMIALLEYAISNKQQSAKFVELAQKRVQQAGEAMEQAAQDRLGASIGALGTSAAFGAGALYNSGKAARQEVASNGKNVKLGAETRARSTGAERAGGQDNDAAVRREEATVEAHSGGQVRVTGDVEEGATGIRNTAQHPTRNVEHDQRQLSDRVVQAYSQKNFAQAQLLNMLGGSAAAAINALGETIAAGSEAKKINAQQAAESSTKIAEQHQDAYNTALQLVVALLQTLQGWQQKNIEGANTIAGNLRV